MLARRAWLGILAASGCGDDGPDCDNADNTGACEACVDLVATAAERCADCGFASREECESQLKAGLPSGGCEGADGVRDEESLYAECLPGLEVISCDDFLSGILDASCMDQIQYRL